MAGSSILCDVTYEQSSSSSIIFSKFTEDSPPGQVGRIAYNSWMEHGWENEKGKLKIKLLIFTLILIYDLEAKLTNFFIHQTEPTEKYDSVT